MSIEEMIDAAIDGERTIDQIRQYVLDTFGEYISNQQIIDYDTEEETSMEAKYKVGVVNAEGVNGFPVKPKFNVGDRVQVEDEEDMVV